MELDPDASGLIETTQLEELIQNLAPPLGSKGATAAKTNQILAHF
jgi:hypothetical protein